MHIPPLHGYTDSAIANEQLQAALPLEFESSRDKFVKAHTEWLLKKSAFTALEIDYHNDEVTHETPWHVIGSTTRYH